jgi:RNA polymerase sigma factor (TIGR02999 family)
VLSGIHFLNWLASPPLARYHLGRSVANYASGEIMADVTRILSAIEEGDAQAAEELLPLVYDELRKLAAQKLLNEKPGQTLQATALVHEAYIRLVDVEKAQHWNSRGHFFGAAAEAMRRILVESARRKGRQKRGGEIERCDVNEIQIAAPVKPSETLAVDAALEGLEVHNELAAKLVKLRYFAGFTNEEAAQMLGISSRKASQLWTYARTWLLAEIARG